MPELVVAFPVNDTEELAWALPPSAHKLEQSIKKWFSQLDDSLFTILYGRYYAHVEIFDYVDIARFIRRTHNHLHSYQKIFKDAGKKYNLDWKFLAAMAYQESHWNPRAQSPTGVRGIMMLTQQTARQVGVKNRLDPYQSIMGGARYFANLHERIPDEVREPDRTWIALAAYNVGMGHIFDARQLARKLGKDPNYWVEFREVLPLLAQPKYYQKLRYGYARGSEPVRFVKRIRNYYDILNNELI
jgi:membrane-bound lytic murein transglycosylase F